MAEPLARVVPDSHRGLIYEFAIHSLREPEEEALRLLDSASTHLRQKLVASGTLKTSDPAEAG